MWVNLLFNPRWVEIQPTEVKVNGIAEALFVPKASASNLDHLDPAIEALSAAVVRL